MGTPATTTTTTTALPREQLREIAYDKLKAELQTARGPFAGCSALGALKINKCDYIALPFNTECPSRYLITSVVECIAADACLTPPMSRNTAYPTGSVRGKIDSDDL